MVLNQIFTPPNIKISVQAMKNKKNPQLGFGTYKIKTSVAKMTEILETAYLAKYDYIDTAEFYRNESVIGAALQNLKTKYGATFDFPVQTKVWPYNYANVRKSVLRSMQKLRVKQLDSVVLHWPGSNLAYDLIAWEQLIELQNEGLIRQIGVSNFEPDMLKFFKPITKVMPAVNQVQFNVYNHSYNYSAMQKVGIQMQAWRPLTLTIKELHADPLIQELATAYSTTPTGIAIGFIKKLKIDPIVKSVTLSRIKANAQAFHGINLTDGDLKKLIAIEQKNKELRFWNAYDCKLSNLAVQNMRKKIEKIKNQKPAIRKITNFFRILRIFRAAYWPKK